VFGISVQFPIDPLFPFAPLVRSRRQTKPPQSHSFCILPSRLPHLVVVLAHRRGDSIGVCFSFRGWSDASNRRESGLGRAVWGLRSDARAAVCELETPRLAAKHDRVPSTCWRRRPRASRPPPSRRRYQLCARRSPRPSYAVEKGTSLGHAATPSYQHENDPSVPPGGHSWRHGPGMHLTLRLDPVLRVQRGLDFDE
jgi:hypothetical protein